MSCRVSFQNLIRYGSALLFILVTSVFVSSPAFAQTSLTIIPPRFELFSNPGETIAEKIRVKNNSDAPVTYTIRVEDFTTSGEEGQVVLEEDQPDTSFSLARWIEPASKDLILQPNEEKSISFIVNTPRNAEPGGHYASILFISGQDNPAVPGGAAVSQRVGSLVLLRVSGNVTEKALLETFSTDKYYDKPPVNFLLRLKNEGNVHLRPQGTIVITDMFGKKVDEVPLDSRNVLPGAIRKMETKWEKKNLLGSYTATLIATYGQQNLPLTAAVKFIVISRTVLILGTVGLVAVVGFILTLIVGRRRFMRVLKVLTKG